MHHSPDLLYPLLSSAIAVAGSWTALSLFNRSRWAGDARTGWIALAAVAMGVSIWSMHFIAMLGFDTGAPAAYDLTLTVLSLAIAMAGTGVAFALLGRRVSRWSTLLAGGSVMGLSIGAMHYIGMAALRTAAVIGYAPAWVAASVVVAVVASTAALVAARRGFGPVWQAGAAFGLGAGIVAMHYTAMAAVVLTPMPGLAPEAGLPPMALAFGVAGLTLLLLFLALGASVLEQKQALVLAMRAGRLGYWNLEVRRGRLVISDQARELLGLAPDDPFDQSDVAALLTPQSAAHRSERLDHAIRTGTDFEADYELRDGRWLEVRGRMLLDGAGRAHRLVGTIQDVTAHRRAFQALARSEARQTLLINELNHRVKNTLATIQSMALLTARKAESLESFSQSFQARLLSLSATHNLLTAQCWERAALSSLFEAEFGHYDAEQIALNGPALWLGAEDVLAVGLVTHELATNAAKYGALSTAEGRVSVDWSLEGEILAIAWRERGGPPVRPPARSGFGSKLMTSTAAHVDARYLPSGFEADIRFRLKTTPNADANGSRPTGPGPVAAPEAGSETVFAHPDILPAQG